VEEEWRELEPLFDAELAQCCAGNFEFSALAGAYIANLHYMSQDLDADADSAKPYIERHLSSGTEIVERVAIHILDQRFDELRDVPMSAKSRYSPKKHRPA
jgi:hypothetical protein